MTLLDWFIEVSSLQYLKCIDLSFVSGASDSREEGWTSEARFDQIIFAHLLVLTNLIVDYYI